MSGAERGDHEARSEGVRRQRHDPQRHRQQRSCGRRRSAPTASPRRPITWVEKGVVKNLSYDRFWANKQGKAFTPTRRRSMSLVMDGGDADDRADDQVDASAVCWSRSSGTSGRSMQMTLLNTGMTRDGMFLIENGEIVGPVQNFRWNDGPARGFNNIIDARPRRCRCTSARPTTTRAPRWCRRCGSRISG